MAKNAEKDRPMKEIKIYTANYCGYCARAKALLRSKGLAFEEIDVTEDGQMRERLVEMSSGRRTVPQIFIGGTAIGGYADLARLNNEGKLDAILNESA